MGVFSRLGLALLLLSIAFFVMPEAAFNQKNVIALIVCALLLAIGTKDKGD